jgi:hypothetical protein
MARRARLAGKEQILIGCRLRVDGVVRGALQRAKLPKLPGKFHTPRQIIKTSAPLGTISKEAPCQCAGGDKLKRCLDSEVRGAGKSSSRGENTRNLQELIPGTPHPWRIFGTCPRTNLRTGRFIKRSRPKFEIHLPLRRPLECPDAPTRRISTIAGAPGTVGASAKSP